MSIYVWSRSHRQMHNLHIAVETDSRNVLGFSIPAKIRLLSLINAVRGSSGLLTGHNLRKNLYEMGMIDSPLCRRCEAEKETSVHVLCE